MQPSQNIIKTIIKEIQNIHWKGCQTILIFQIDNFSYSTLFSIDNIIKTEFPFKTPH